MHTACSLDLSCVCACIFPIVGQGSMVYNAIGGTDTPLRQSFIQRFDLNYMRPLFGGPSPHNVSTSIIWLLQYMHKTIFLC